MTSENGVLFVQTNNSLFKQIVICLNTQLKPHFPMSSLGFRRKERLSVSQVGGLASLTDFTDRSQQLKVFMGMELTNKSER